MRKLRAMWPYSEDRWFFTLVSLVIHLGMYLGMNTVIYYLSRYGFLLKYRINPPGPKEPTMALIKATIIENLPSHLVLQPLLAAYALEPLLKYNGGGAFADPLPGFWKITWQFGFCSIALDFGFYFAHRLFHHEKFYWMHKQHHEYREPVGFASEYAHPVEQIIANALPTILPPIFLGVHPNVWFVWITWRLFETYVAHSGLDLPIFDFGCGFGQGAGRAHKNLNWSYSRYHDFHHTNNFGNFGSEFVDHIFNTNDLWVQHVTAFEKQQAGQTGPTAAPAAAASPAPSGKSSRKSRTA